MVMQQDINTGHCTLMLMTQC